MTQEEIKEKFYQLVGDVLGISDVNDDTVLYSSDLDSMDVLLLDMECQKEFGFKTPDDVGEDWGTKTLEEIALEIERLLQD